MKTNQPSNDSSAMRSAIPATPLSNWHESRLLRFFLYFLFFCAALIFARCYLLDTISYLNLDKYIAGTERLPYQRRLLPMLILRALLRIPMPHILSSHFVIFSRPAQLYLLGLHFVSVMVAGYFATLLYRRAQPTGRLPLLVFPLYLFCSMWTYLMRPLFSNGLPYDLTSQAFFAGGLLCIYKRSFWPLLGIIAVGTFNRETTLFLVILFVIDAWASNAGSLTSRIPWVQAISLGSLWVAIKIFLKHLFVMNNASEQFLRLRVNAHSLLPSNWPQILTACGFLLPIVWIFRRNIPNPRLTAWVLILPCWVVVMLFYGVIVESRIFGELCPLVAVFGVILLEEYMSPHRELAQTF